MSDNRENICILGIETSGLTSGVAVSVNDQLLAYMSLNRKNIHSRRLAMMADQVLAHADLKYSDISAIALSAGPGSFTGLRIGYSLAKGLAHAMRVPIIQVPTLDIWAYQQGRSELPVLSVIDAHRQEIFCGLYHWNDESLQRDGEYRLLALQSLSGFLTRPTLVVGGDVPKLKEKIAEYGGDHARFPYPMITDPQNWGLQSLGHQKFLAGEISTAEECEPLYMRAFKGVM